MDNIKQLKDAYLSTLDDMKKSDLLLSYKTNNSFKDKNIIVTGATGGIGSVIVGCYLELGARVCAIVRNDKKFLELFQKEVDENKRIKEEDKKRLFVEVIDLESPILINKGFSNIVKNTFKGKIDGLVMCHGLFTPGRLVETYIDSFDTNLNINVRSSFHLLSICTPFLKLTKGNVVILSSIFAKILYKDSFLESLSNVINSLNFLVYVEFPYRMLCSRTIKFWSQSKWSGSWNDKNRL
jgi:hypothetical protein